MLPLRQIVSLRVITFFDALDLAIDVVGRFGIDIYCIEEIAFVADLPKKTYRPYATIAYRVRVSNKATTKTRILWRKQQEQFDEFLIPKHVAGKEEVKDIINDLSGPLVCRSSKRNSCFDFEGGASYDPLSFKLGTSGVKPYREELKRLTGACRKRCKDLPTAVIQIKGRINWRWLSHEGYLEKTVLFCRHLDPRKWLKFATFLTTCCISCHFCSINTLVIDTAGIASSLLVRLMHCAEVPIPTTVKQGAYGFSFRGNGLHR